MFLLGQAAQIPWLGALFQAADAPLQSLPPSFPYKSLGVPLALL